MSSTEAALKDAFRAIDTDNSGFIEIGELQKLIRSYLAHKDCPSDVKAKHSDADVMTICQDFLKKSDKNADNKLSLQEFVDYFSQP